VVYDKNFTQKLTEKKFKLLLRGSRDGFQAYVFHQKCDQKGETIVIVESTLGHVFGGYTTIPWSSANNYVNDTKSFIFLLRSTKGSAPSRWEVTNTANAIYSYTAYGPTFGGGFDFYLCDNCNSTNSSYSNLGHSYGAPKDTSLLAGAYNFTVKDYECFQVV